MNREEYVRHFMVHRGAEMLESIPTSIKNILMGTKRKINL
jgi:hypothetical protein